MRSSFDHYNWSEEYRIQSSLTFANLYLRERVQLMKPAGVGYQAKD